MLSMAAKKYIRVGVVKTKHKALLPLKVDDIFNSLGAREGQKMIEVWHLILQAFLRAFQKYSLDL